MARYCNNRGRGETYGTSIPYPYGVADTEVWIRYATGQDPETIFAIASGTEAIGCIGMLLQSDVARLSAEVGYWLENPTGTRYRDPSLKALTDYAFTEFGLARLHATVMVRNPASARALEKAGYQHEGRTRKAPSRTGK